MDRRFIRCFALVTAVLTVAVYLTAQAARHGGVVLPLLGAVAVGIGVIGLTGLARVVAITARESRQQ